MFGDPANHTIIRMTPAKTLSVLINPMMRLLRSDAIEHLAVRGSVWSITGYLIMQGMRLAANLILARILMPEAFGAVSLVWVISLGLSRLSDFGMSQNVMQAKREDASFLNTIWTFEVARGISMWLLLCLLAAPIAHFYHQPQLVVLLPVGGLSLVLSGLTSTKADMAKRQLMLGKLTLIEVGDQLLTSIVMVIWVLIYPSIWALVISPVLCQLIQVTLTHLILPGSANSFQWDRTAFAEMLQFGKWMFVITTLVFIAARIDQLILGRLTTPDAFGVYAVASAVAMLPHTIILRLANQIMFPAVTRFARERSLDAMRDSIVRSRRAFLSLGLIMILALYLFSVPFFSLLYDARYASAGTIARDLSWFIWTVMLQVSVDRVLLALGGAKETTLVYGLRLLAMMVFTLIGYQLSTMQGFIIGLAVGTLIAGIAAHIMLRRHGLMLIGQDLLYSAVLVAAVVIQSLWGAEPNTPISLALDGLLVCIIGAGLAYAYFSTRERLQGNSLNV